MQTNIKYRDYSTCLLADTDLEAFSDFIAQRELDLYKKTLDEKGLESRVQEFLVVKNPVFYCLLDRKKIIGTISVDSLNGDIDNVMLLKSHRDRRLPNMLYDVAIRHVMNDPHLSQNPYMKVQIHHEKITSRNSAKNAGLEFAHYANPRQPDGMWVYRLYLSELREFIAKDPKPRVENW